MYKKQQRPKATYRLSQCGFSSCGQGWEYSLVSPRTKWTPRGVRFRLGRSFLAAKNRIQQTHRVGLVAESSGGRGLRWMRKLAAFGTEMGRSSRNPIVKEGSRRKQGQIVVVALEVGELNVLAVVVRVMGSLMRNFLAFHRLWWR